MKKLAIIIGGVGVVLGIAFLLFLQGGRSASVADVLFEARTLLDYHNGDWVATMRLAGSPVPVSATNDLHVDPETNRITVYAQARALSYNKPYHDLSAVENDLYSLEAEYEAARLLVLKAVWMADNRQPNSMNASMSKAKAGRTAVEVALKCVEICGQLGYSKTELLEKFARDAKIVDIYEGTQQINQLIIARHILGKNSSELK